MFLSSDMGKRVLNFCYSWGASIVNHRCHVQVASPAVW